MVPDEAAVLPAAARKGETGPGADRLLVAGLLAAVFRVYGDGLNLFQFIPAHAVVEHDVAEHADAGGMKGTDCIEIFFFRAVFCTDRSFLIELSEIIHIINAVANVILRDSFVGGRKPDLCNPEGGKVICLRSAALPPQPVVRQIPFEILHHRIVIFQRIPPLSVDFACFTTKK